MPRRLAAAALLALALAGCGDSKDADTAAPPSPTRTSGTGPTAPAADAEVDYQRRMVDAISAATAFAVELSKVRGDNLAALAPRLSQRRREFVQASTVARRLRAPADRGEQHRRMVNALRALDRSMQGIVAAARAGDRERFLAADEAYVRASQGVSAAGQALSAGG